MPDEGSPEVAALVEAACSARWMIHAQLLANYESAWRKALHEGNDELAHRLYSLTMGQEIAAEVGIELARALLPFVPDRPACKGCNSYSDQIWAKSPQAVVALTTDERKTA